MSGYLMLVVVISLKISGLSAEYETPIENPQNLDKQLTMPVSNENSRLICKIDMQME